MSSQVTEDRVAGLTEVSIAGLGLAIGDLLPTGLLDELPLGTLLDLLDQLPITLPTDLTDAVAEVEASSRSSRPSSRATARCRTRSRTCSPSWRSPTSPPPRRS
ncbi:hypothetical protein [Nitriliruptor alkaliphilus]|uniref:hypothetical protein n=1 Tax=Nitriliruptor alkaliphilus TaxID=427918 RepID=UPI000699180B|nr:hypothetical protein [Nitriliruptor alkaliphilus]